MKIFTIITGALLTVLGFYAFGVPIRTFLGIGWLLGTLLLINGIELVIASLKKEKKDIWNLILGALDVIIGLVILFNGVQRALTDVMVAYLIGAGILVYGIVQVVFGCKVFKIEKTASIIRIICGVIGIIAGLGSIGHPFMTMLSVGYIIAINIVVQGINIIVFGFMMKNKEA